MERLTQQEIREFQDVFNLVDTDQGGSISIKELQSLMITLGMNTSNEELKQMMNEVDENRNGEIDFQEFLQIICCDTAPEFSREEVLKAFKTFAGDAPEGFIAISSLERALKIYGKNKLTEEQAANLVKRVDKSGDKFFNYEAHINAMMSPPQGRNGQSGSSLWLITSFIVFV